MQLEHIIPKFKQGTNHDNNLVPSCFECNNGKRTSELEKESQGFLSLSNSSADLPENNATVALVEGENDSSETVQEENLKFNGVVSFVKTFFDKAKSGRYADEQRWLNCYRNHRGIYGPDVVFTSTEKSRAFIKITKTKVLASYAKVVDVLFSGKKFQIYVVETT